MADLQNPYRQLPSETGGQAYHMECVFCHEWHSMMSSAPFVHAITCPAGILEQQEFEIRRKNSMGRKMARFFVSVVYLLLLAFVAGIFLGITGAGFGPHPILLIGVMLIYWGTKEQVLTKFGLPKVVPPIVTTTIK
jgi:hypothetical protein